MERVHIQKKLKRDKPNKKWMDWEIKKILSYLQESSEIEAPTAQIYYKELIEKTKIDSSWDLIRWKVRHLKSCFKKANEWRKSTIAKLLEHDAGTACVEGKVLQMCPHYYQLAEIFGEKTQEGAHVVIDSGVTIPSDESLCEVMNEPMEEPNAEPLNEVICSAIMKFERASPIEEFCDEMENNTPSSAQADSGESNASQNAPTIIFNKINDLAERMKTHAPPKSSSVHLAAFQAERTILFKMKLEWEKEKQITEFTLSERKLKLEEQKTKSEIDLRKQELEIKRLEIEKDERIKTLEIERDERLKKFEIELKYKNKS